MHDGGLELRPGVKFLTAHTVTLSTMDQLSYPSIQEAEAGVQTYAMSEGFTVARKRSKASKTNEIRKVWLTCAHGREYKNSREYLNEETRKCQRSSRASNCPFSAIIQHIASAGDEWEWHVIFDCNDHNHNSNEAILCYHAAHKFLAYERETVKAITEMAATPKVILAALRQSNPDRPLIPRDIYKERVQIRSNKFEGRTPIEVLLDYLRGSG